MLWYGQDMEHLAEALDTDGRLARPSPIPTTPPHPIPDGGYDDDGFLYELREMQNFRHNTIMETTGVLLRTYLARKYGARALVVGDAGVYARWSDKHRPPLGADILVSLTAGALDAPGTPPERLRRSYKLWQEPVPDLVLEIVSTSSVRNDLSVKPRRYEEMGIPEFWVFDPDEYTELPNGLGGWLLVDGYYRRAEMQAPQPGIPSGTTAYWSETLGLFIYSDGADLAFHHPETGRLPTLAEETAAREAAEEARAVAEAARRDAEAAQREAEARAEALAAELAALKRGG